MVRSWLAATAILAVTGALIGCGEGQPSPPYNYNMGSEPGQLMPTPPPAPDLGILEERIAVRPSPVAAPAETAETETSTRQPTGP